MLSRIRVRGISSIAAFLVTMALAGCAHPERVSRGAVRRLTASGTPFVLVFGSLATAAGRPARPAIRFVYQTSRTAPEYLLASLTLADDRRFHAILRAPNDAEPAIPYLDHIYIEVGSEAAGFDRILYVHLQRQKAPLAMYVGEIRIEPARNRNAQGEKVAVNVLDDFANASRELKRLYPEFEGTFDNEARLLPRNSNAAPTPERVR